MSELYSVPSNIKARTLIDGDTSVSYTHLTLQTKA